MTKTDRINLALETSFKDSQISVMTTVKVIVVMQALQKAVRAIFK